MKRIIFLIALALVFNRTIVLGTTYYSIANGSWDVPSTWSTDSCGGLAAATSPAVSDSVVICSGTTVSLAANTTIRAVLVDAGGVLDNVSSDLSLQGIDHNQRSSFIINGNYTGGGQTLWLNYFTGTSLSTLSGTGIISTAGDWIFEYLTGFGSGVSIPSGTFLTITNSSFFIETSYFWNYGELTFTNGSIFVGPATTGTGGQLRNYGNLTLTTGNLNIQKVNLAQNFKTITVGGNITGIDPSCSFYNISSGSYTNPILNVAGELLLTGVLYVNKSHGTVNYNGVGNQIIKKPTVKFGIYADNTYYNLKCSNSGIKTLEANAIIKGNLTIRDAAQLDVSSNFNITLKGNWYDSSTVTDPFVERTGKVTFSGDSTQNISTSPLQGGETFYNLVINNSDTGVVLINSNINVSDTLTLSDGLLHTGVDTVWVNNSDTFSIIAYSDTSYVNGYLKRNISPTTDSSYDFPVGNATAYALANVKFFGSNTVGNITTDFSNPSGGSTLTPLTDANDAEYTVLLNCGGASAGSGDANAGVWNIRPGKGSAIYDLSLYGRHFDNAGTIYHSIVKRNSNLLPWEFAGTYLPAELKTDTLIAKRTCLTDFYQFAITGSNTTSPLNNTPISFSSPDNMICGSKCIDFISKNNFSATAWRWTRSGGPFSSTIDTALQNPSGICFNDLGKYDVRLIASTACHADTLELTQYVKVNPIPTITINGNNSICSGENTVLTASSTGTGISYLWNSITTTAAISVSPIITTTYSIVASTAFCSDTAMTTIAVTTTPTASINANTTAICSGENVSLTANGAAEAYLWNTEETGTVIIVSPLLPVDYSLSAIRYSLKLSNGNCSNTDSILINVTTTPTATITTTGETSICSGKRILLSAASAIPDVTYLWNNATTSQSINAIPLTNTTYSVVLSNGNCKDTAAIDINVTTTPTLILTANRSIICSGESVALSATGAGDYLWSTGESGTSITASPLLPVRYSLKLSNGSCSDIDSILITVVPTPTASISGTVTVCSGNSTILTASAGGGGESAYLWSKGETSAEIIITPSINTVYSVTVSNGNGLCTDTASRSISLITPIPADAGPDITMAIGLDTVLTANDGVAWNWTPKVRMDCSTCQNPIVAPFQTTSYTVTVTDINGCVSSDSVKVYVIPCAELFVPKAFSPNNDGQNDVLYIRGTDCIDKVISFIIFNRWGEKVFETTDIKTGWDGSQSKDILSNEVFIYYLDALAINGDAISKTGNVTMIK